MMEKISTEQKILDAAKLIFSKKGFAATRTRDIAEEADINLALLNYHFGSKEKLFKLIVEEKFKELFGTVQPVLSDAGISLKEKAATLTENYTRLLLEDEDLAMFVLNQIKTDQLLLRDVIQKVKIFTVHVIEKQLRDSGFRISVVDYVMNIISLSLFPFLSKELFISAGLIEKENFEELIQERSRKIPDWIMQILNSTKKEI